MLTIFKWKKSHLKNSNSFMPTTSQSADPLFRQPSIKQKYFANNTSKQETILLWWTFSDQKLKSHLQIMMKKIRKKNKIKSNFWWKMKSLPSRWIYLCWQNTKMQESYHLITGSSMVFAKSSYQPMLSFLMLAFLHSQMHLLKCTTICSINQQLAEFVAIWVWEYKDLKIKTK